MSRGGWAKSTRERPCDLCGNTSGWCKDFGDGAVWCGHVIDGGGIAPAGWRLITSAEGGSVLRRESDNREVDRDAWERLAEQRRAFDALKIDAARAKWDEARANEDPDIAIGYLSRRGVPVHRLPAFSDDHHAGKLPPTIVGVAQWDDEYFDEGRREYVSLGQWPAIVCAFVGSDHEIVALQQIFLDRDDPSAKRTDKTRAGAPMPAKRQRGVMVGGGAVRLGMKFDKGLVLCEGVETGLAIAACTGAGVWCCLSTSGLSRPGLAEDLVAPKGDVKRVTFGADHDKYNEKLGARPGEHAARAAADVLARTHEGLEVLMAIPTHDTAPTLIGADGDLL